MVVVNTYLVRFGLRIETRAERTTIVDIFDIIQQVQDTGIHLEVDEEQWKITQGSERQAKWVWCPHAMSGLRFPDTPHAQKILTTVCCCCLKNKQNAPRPSEHPPVRGEKMSKRSGGIKGCKFKTSYGI